MFGKIVAYVFNVISTLSSCKVGSFATFFFCAISIIFKVMIKAGLQLTAASSTESHDDDDDDDDNDDILPVLLHNK